MIVFIIDDDKAFCTLLSTYLLKNGATEVHTFDFISKALQQGTTPDIIFLDHYVHGMEGTRFLPEIVTCFPRAVIFYVSGQQRLEVAVKAKQLGALHYFKKDKQLFDRITEQLVKLNQKSVSDQSPATPPKPAIQQTPLIYMLDDDKLFSTFIRYRLTKMHRRNIRIFHEPVPFYEALDEKPDIIILDYHLASTTGNDVFRQIKQYLPSPQVIMFSSQQNLDIALELYDLGIADYVVKNKAWEVNLNQAIQNQIMPMR